jgi:hypothetical protein
LFFVFLALVPFILTDEIQYHETSVLLSFSRSVITYHYYIGYHSGKGISLQFLRLLSELEDPAFEGDNALSMLDKGRFNVYIKDNHAKLFVFKALMVLPKTEGTPGKCEVMRISIDQTSPVQAVPISVLHLT